MVQPAKHLEEKAQVRASKGMQTALVSVFINLTLSVVKILGGIFGNSYALIADGIESFLDIFSSTIVWGGLKIGSLPPDRNHPFGHGRAESLAGVMVSFGLIAAGIMIAVQSIREIFSPQFTPYPFTLVILIGVIVTKELLSRFLLKVGKEFDSTSLVSDAWHSRSDALTSAAAFIGISISLLSHGKLAAADDWAALIASGIILFNGIRIVKMSIGEIMDEAVDPIIEERVRLIARSVNKVKGVEKCRIRKSGFTYFVELHVEVDGSMTVTEGHNIAHLVKDALLNSELKILDATIHIEPFQVEYVI
jgi:cation diffusion facilitator family transporter